MYIDLLYCGRYCIIMGCCFYCFLVKKILLGVLFFLFSVPKAIGSGLTARPKSLPTGVGFRSQPDQIYLYIFQLVTNSFQSSLYKY